MTNKILAIILLIISTINTYAQKEDFFIIPDNFFKTFKAKGSDAAIDYIYSTNKYLSVNMPANLKIKAELKKITSMVDDYYDYELVKKILLGKSYVKLIYIGKFKRQPIRFIFILYKPDNNWQLQQFKFDDKVAKLLE
jgi:hypothetical protein